jgi:hypothetical protein
LCAHTRVCVCVSARERLSLRVCVRVRVGHPNEEAESNILSLFRASATGGWHFLIKRFGGSGHGMVASGRRTVKVTSSWDTFPQIFTQVAKERLNSMHRRWS